MMINDLFCVSTIKIFMKNVQQCLPSFSSSSFQKNKTIFFLFYLTTKKILSKTKNVQIVRTKCSCRIQSYNLQPFLDSIKLNWIFFLKLGLFRFGFGMLLKTLDECVCVYIYFLKGDL